MERNHDCLWAPNPATTGLFGDPGEGITQRSSARGTPKATALLKAFLAQSVASVEKPWPQLARVRDLINELLFSPAGRNPRYGAVAEMRAFQEPGAHSVSVGSLGRLRTLALGAGDEEGVANLVVVAAFHDVGLALRRAASTTSFRSGIGRESGEIAHISLP